MTRIKISQILLPTSKKARYLLCKIKNPSDARVNKQTLMTSDQNRTTHQQNNTPKQKNCID